MKPAPPVAIAGLCLSVVPSEGGILLLSLPPYWGLCPPGSPCQPHTGAAVVPLCCVGSACWECASSLGVSFCSWAARQSLWACQLQSLMAKVTERKNDSEVCQSGAVRPHLTVCALCWRLLSICPAGNPWPLFPIQPRRSQGLLEEYLPFPSLGDNFISPLP